MSTACSSTRSCWAAAPATSRSATRRSASNCWRPVRSAPVSSTFGTGVSRLPLAGSLDRVMAAPDSVIVTRLRAAGCVFAEDEARLLVSAARTPVELALMVDRRVAGLPLEQVLGWAEFCGLRIAVDPGVFVPRRRTEFLVRQAVLARVCEDVARPGNVGIVDLCCGAGAIGAALAAALGGAEVHAVDIDPAAVRCAGRNVRGRVYQGEPGGPFGPRARHAEGPDRPAGRQRALRADRGDRVPPPGGAVARAARSA